MKLDAAIQDADELVKILEVLQAHNQTANHYAALVRARRVLIALHDERLRLRRHHVDCRTRKDPAYPKPRGRKPGRPGPEVPAPALLRSADLPAGAVDEQ